MKIIQFSDLHLFQAPEQKLLNINTLESLRQVLRAAAADMRSADAVFVTGDISQDQTPVSYQCAKHELSRLKPPVYCLPGNHDAPSVMKKTLSSSRVHLKRQFLLGPWNVVFLDTTVSGKNGGNFRASELAFLRKSLKAHPNRPALISFHHSVLKTGSAWLDTMQVTNADEFFRIIDKEPQVRAVVFGHVHQAFAQKRKNVSYVAAPATCIQFKPKNDRFKLDIAAPGYQVIELKSNGKIRAQVKRVKNYPFKPDMLSQGY